MIVPDWKLRASVIFCRKNTICSKGKIYVGIIEFPVAAWAAQALPIACANEWLCGCSILIWLGINSHCLCQSAELGWEDWP